MRHAKNIFKFRISKLTLAVNSVFFVMFLFFTGDALAQIACPGLASTVPSPNGMYKVTAFGCVNGWTDPNDNCIPARQPAICEGRSGPDCERWLNWYAANVDVFGANKKVLVTRPDTGKSVVVMTIDIGPNCTRERIYGPLLDLSYSAATYLGPAGGNYETVSARLVPDDTPLGPTDGSGIPVVDGSGDPTTGGTGEYTSGSYRFTLTARILPETVDTYIINRAEATAVGGGTATTTTTGGVTGGSCQPVTAYPGDIRAELQSKWGITANGFDASKLRLIYEVFSEIQQTGFLPLVRGAVIQATGGASGQQVGCPGDGATDVIVGTGFNDASFKQILIHELAHTLQFCQPDSVSHFSEIGQAIAQDGPVSGYSQSLCLYGGGNEDIRRMEDYAETISFHLNPNSGEVTCGSGPNPFQSGGKTAHKALATRIVGSYACTQ